MSWGQRDIVRLHATYCSSVTVVRFHSLFCAGYRSSEAGVRAMPPFNYRTAFWQSYASLRIAMGTTPSVVLQALRAPVRKPCCKLAFDTSEKLGQSLPVGLFHPKTILLEWFTVSYGLLQ